jgi:hypothetical protein
MCKFTDKIGNSPLGVRGKGHCKNGVGELYERKIIFKRRHVQISLIDIEQRK